jgi:hypothetical protein
MMLEMSAWISLGLASLCAIVITVDIVRHPQKMGVMNFVWPLTALYGSAFALWGYFRYGRQSTSDVQKLCPKISARG